MTREEKAQEFARNCAEYNNLPIEVEHLLHTAFIVGYNEREDEEKNPWHKASEELPSSEGDYIIAYNLPDGIKTYIDMASFHDNVWFPTRHFKNMDIIAWMPIPEIKED